MPVNYAVKRAIKSIRNGGRPSLQYIKDEKVKKVLRGIINGNRPVVKTGDIEIDKQIRSLL